MSKKEKKPLVPALRFPEFRDKGEWEKRELRKLVAIIKEKAGNNKFTPMSISGGLGLVSQIEKFGREIAGAQYKNYFVIRKNDFAYNKSATREYHEGYIAMYSGDDPAAVPNSIFTCFKVCDDNVFPRYLNYLFLVNLHGKWLKKYIMVGARAHGSLNIDNDDLLSLPVPLPLGESSLNEQQKIADCLTSIDELITCQTQKLDTLKAHKKGLMWQLFPAEGETVPKLRFPEFWDAGEWVQIQLGQLGVLVSGLTYSPNDIREEGLLVLRSSNVQNGVISLEDNVFVKPETKGANLSKPDDILICVRNGSKPLIGKNALIPEGMPQSTHGAFMTVFRSKKAKFVYQLLQTSAYENQVAADLGATINSINGARLKKYEFYIPKMVEEQQKIADCLSSLDELITAQTQILDALKVHKTGLMQQLFPDTDEVGE